MAPIARTHQPSTVDAAMLSTATTAASTSMSKRAPRSLAVLVARATGPSTASRSKATAAGTTSHHDRTERSDTRDATHDRETHATEPGARGSHPVRGAHGAVPSMLNVRVGE